MLKLFSLIAWVVAIALPLSVLALFPLADMIGSGIAGALLSFVLWYARLVNRKRFSQAESNTVGGADRGSGK